MIAVLSSLNLKSTCFIRFELLDYYKLDLNLSKLMIEESSFMNTNQVALFQVLKEKSTDTLLIVATTHAVWAPQKNIIKLS